MHERDRTSIGDIYGSMLNSVKRNIHESNKAKSFDTPKYRGTNGTGPSDADGYNPIEHKDNEASVKPDELAKHYGMDKRAKTVDKMRNAMNSPRTSPESKKQLKRDIDNWTDESEESEDSEDSEESKDSQVITKNSNLFNKKKTTPKKKISVAEIGEDEEILEMKKNAGRILNNVMKKSYFDTMYKKVLRENFGDDEEGGGDDLDALGLDDATPDSEYGDDEFGDEGEGEDSVTFTLDRTTAQTLIDVLQGALGEGEGEGGDEFGDEGEGDLDFGDEGEGEGEDEHNFDREDNEEAVNSRNSGKSAPDGKQKLQGKKNSIGVFKTAKKASHTVDAGYDDNDVGTDGGGIPSFKHLQGQNNKVPGSTLTKGKSYF